MKTEKEKMIAGELYDTSDKELADLRQTAHNLSQKYSNTFETQQEERKEIISKLLPNSKGGVYLQGPIFFDYGIFTSFGKNFYANANFTVLDCCPVTIGDNVLIGPNCTLATPVHPMNAEERRIKFKADGTPYEYEYAKPITIGNDCWLASNVVVCAGVTIGDGTVIGAGSVVTRDIPSGVFAAGNPCKVIKTLDNDNKTI